MSYTRSQARTKIREILREFYDSDTVATGGINASSETLPITSISRYSIGDILQVESELMIVRSLDSTASPTTATVTRGVYESTAASHSAAVAIKIIPEFSDRSLNTAINSAIADTFDGYGGMWIETLDTSLTSDSTAREYTIPAGFSNIHRIQIADDEGFFQELKSWELIGTKIQFYRELPYNGTTIRCIGTSFQALLSDDTTTFDLADEQVEFVIWDSVWFAIQQRFAHRIKAIEYSAAVNDRAGQPNEMINMVNNIRRTVELIRKREFKNRPSEYSPRPRR